MVAQTKERLPDRAGSFEGLDVKPLSEPITLPVSGLVAPNRFLKSAMTERLSRWNPTEEKKRGKPTDNLVRLYETWGKGKIGIIMSGNILVHRAHLEAAGNAIIDYEIDEDYTPDFARVVQAARAHESLFIAQLSHGGRQTPADIQPNPVSSSDVQLPPSIGKSFAKPTPLTKEGIKDVVKRFAHAATVCKNAGFQGVQLRCAHGYLLSQFLSSRVNLRTDEYGGSLENRSRIIFEILDAIKEKIPDPKFSLSVKINSHDFIEGGFSDDECKILAERLDQKGLDFIELSGGSYENMAFEHKRESTKRREAFFLDFASKIKPNIKKALVCVTGGFRSAQAMVTAVKEGTTELIGIARPLCAEPYFPAEIIEKKIPGAKINKVPPITQYEFAVAYHQIPEIGEGKPPTDFSMQENADKLVERMNALSANSGV